MRRRTQVVPTGRGEGRIAVSCVIRRLLDETIGASRYLALVREGMLDMAGRPTKFDSTDEALERLRATRDIEGMLDMAGSPAKFDSTDSALERLRTTRDIPRGLPGIAGDVTWRRREARWSLDVTSGEILPGVHWWDNVAKGHGDAKMRLDDVSVPEAALARLPGMPLRELVAHPLLDDPRLVIRSATMYRDIEIMLDAPRDELPD